MKNSILGLAIILGLSGYINQSFSQIIEIPSDFATIQEGISNAQNGDTVLVAPGEYFENLNMKGKNILLASHFVIDGNLDHINNTIINGSQPAHKDTASCILIVSGESRDCVIAGFTITGGKGTRWEDEHNIRNWYTEGGGILIQYSSPTIRNNIIRDNEANIRNTRNVSSGGGAIRMGDSNPMIINNYIHHNIGRYGGGIVLNYSGGILRNNLITNNSGGQDFGGGGVWILGNSEHPRILENNTIINNRASNIGGGVRVWMSEVLLSNNIIRSNRGTSGHQVAGGGIITYCNIEGGKEGEGNIDEGIRFDSPLMYLPDGDLSIDAGNPHASYEDKEDPELPGSAIFPSKGTLRNDMGCYGGPGAMQFPEPDLSNLSETFLKKELLYNIFPNPASGKAYLVFENDVDDEVEIEIIDINGRTIRQIYNSAIERSKTIDLNINGLSRGLYFVRARSSELITIRKLVIN